MPRKPATATKAKHRSGKIPPVPQRIKSGKEPLAAHYSGNWQPVKSKTLPATREELEAVTAEMDAAIAGSVDIAADRRQVWAGKVYELAQFVENAHIQGHLGKISLGNAFEQACKNYVQPDGKPFTPESLRESLRQVKNKSVGRVRP